MKEWLNQLFSLSGVVIGTLLGWLISRYQLRYQDSRERKKLILQKLEELHGWLSHYSDGHFRMMQEQTKNQIEDVAATVIPPHLMPKRPESSSENISEESLQAQDRIRALVGFYAPELSDDLKELEKVGGDFCEMIFRDSGNHLLSMLEEEPAQTKGMDWLCT